MRDFLENVEKGSEDPDVLNPLKSAQKGMRPQLPKRFYKLAEAIEIDNLFSVSLDGKQIKTPGGNAVVVPTKTLAELMGEEWQAQGKEIKKRK